jgi:hypothetical protein
VLRSAIFQGLGSCPTTRDGVVREAVDALDTCSLSPAIRLDEVGPIFATPARQTLESVGRAERVELWIDGHWIGFIDHEGIDQRHQQLTLAEMRRDVH